jgi:hypothetical protein
MPTIYMRDKKSRLRKLTLDTGIKHQMIYVNGLYICKWCSQSYPYKYGNDISKEECYATKELYTGRVVPCKNIMLYDSTLHNSKDIYENILLEIIIIGSYNMTMKILTKNNQQIFVYLYGDLINLDV